AEMWRQFGDVLATPEERIVIAEDGDTLSLNGRELVFMDSPGHARHHFCIWDENSRGWFAGDSFGMSYRNFDTANGPFIFPTTTPIDFDPGAMHDTIEKMLARDPVCIYLTHYGRVENPAPLAQDMHRRVDGLVEIAERNEGAEDCAACIAQEVEAWLMDEAVTHGVDLPAARLRELLATDIELNTQGLVVWLQRRRKA
ncbi:MAG: MBL fold metallo-hydrolase, partial [Sinobacteraceae bacterium]|nr:MBL fold metallo-hydrolase [Nevskiaceae bacterium]